MTDAIVAEGLVKRFGDSAALDGLDITVAEGTVLGLLGPNGSGKTTTVKILSTLWRPDAGRALVAGVDVMKEPAKVRRRIGLAGQFSAVDYTLTGRENLVLFGRLYRLGHRQAQKRADRLLERFNLAEVGRKPVKTYSGGMIRKLDLAVSLVASPRVLFMDEPTTGLDPSGRLELYDLLEEQVRAGMTLLLTSQYLEEVDRLATQIAVLARGKVIALGTADELKSQVGGDRVDVTLADPAQVRDAVATLRSLGRGEPSVDVTGTVVGLSAGSSSIAEVVRTLDRQGIAMQDIALHRPTLDDVFLTLTGASTLGVAAWSGAGDAAGPAEGVDADPAGPVPAEPPAPAAAASAEAPAEVAPPEAPVVDAPAAPAVRRVAAAAPAPAATTLAERFAAMRAASGSPGARASAEALAAAAAAEAPAAAAEAPAVAASAGSPVAPAPSEAPAAAVPVAPAVAAAPSEVPAAPASAPTAMAPAAAPAEAPAADPEATMAWTMPADFAREPAGPNGSPDPAADARTGRSRARRSHRAPGPPVEPTPEEIAAAPRGAHAAGPPSAPGGATAVPRRREQELPAAWFRPQAADPANGGSAGGGTYDPDATDPHGFVLAPADPAPGTGRRRTGPDSEQGVGR